jgi:O-antigen ligase
MPWSVRNADRLFFSFPLLPRPTPLPVFQHPLLSSFLACLLASLKIPAAGLLLPLTPSIVFCLLFAIVGCVSVVADGGSGGKKEAK